ncbi:MAG: molecular chaperone DnaJ [Sphingomonadales bacterium]|nr:molecular chaperone DnaJ [Sphingomonadales bacterium]
MPLLLVLLAGLGLWFWLGKRRKKIPALWLGIGGTLAGAVLVAKGMPVVGALVATGSGLWLRYGEMLMRGRSAGPPPPSTSPAEIDRAQAAELLGVAPDADREEILAAYRRLMARNHPDAGGSAGLAARINAARDLLLKSKHN